MKTIWILTLVIASFWLTLFLSALEPAKQETPGKSFQPAVLKLPQAWRGDYEYGFVFKVLSDEHAQVQIVLGLGSFKLNESHRFQKKLQG